MSEGKTRPWLSVLVPVYNVEPYLAECVESVLRQADAGVELLLMDDCSTDGSLALMQRLAERHPGRLQILRAERNGGLSATRNRLLEASHGEWIWFLDSDDFLRDGALDGLRASVDRTPELDLVLCDFCDYREHPKLKHRLRGEHHKRTHRLAPGEVCRDRSRLLEGSLLQGHLHSWSKIARRALWGEDLRFPEGHYFEDIATTPGLLLRSRAAVYLDRVWVAYRKRAGSILATTSAKKTDDMQDALNGLPALIDAQRPALDAAARLAAAHFVAKMYVGAARFAHEQRDDARQAAYFSQFERNLPVSLAELLGSYLRRGWPWRAVRVLYWSRKGRHARQSLSTP